MPKTEITRPALRRLNEQLARWAFTNFEQARAALAELNAQLGANAPFDLRLAYHRHAAFLENQWQHYDRALDHLTSAIAILERLADTPQLGEAWLDAAAVHLNRRDWSAAQEALDRARRYLATSPEPRLRAQIACREGFLHLHLRNYRQALDHLAEAEKLLLALGGAASLKDYYILSLATTGLGDLYGLLDERDNSLDAYRRALPIVEEHNLLPRRAWIFLNAGRAALALQEHSEARMYFEKVLRFAAEGDQDTKAMALGNLGRLAFIRNDAAEALRLFDEAQAQFPEPSKPSDFTNLSIIESWRAGVLHASGDMAQVQLHLEEAFALGQRGHDLNHQAQVAQNLATLCAGQQAFSEAYAWQKEATELLEKHFHKVHDIERQEIEARHQLERVRQEAQMARLRVTSLQLRALRAQMNPHFLFNALNAIQGFITSGRNEEAEIYLPRFAKLMRQTLDYSDKEVVTLEEEIDFLNRYLNLNKKLRFRDKLDFQIISPKIAEMEDIFIPTMIVQPFVENAIEHGLRPRQEGALRIEFQTIAGAEEDASPTLLCIIEDDGVGYNKGLEKQSDKPAFQSHRSRGMEITRDRLTLLHQLRHDTNGPYVRIQDLGDISGGERRGTRVEVLLPMMEPEE